MVGREGAHPGPIQPVRDGAEVKSNGAGSGVLVTTAESNTIVTTSCAAQNTIGTVQWQQ